jgi:hypothetical protein
MRFVFAGVVVSFFAAGCGDKAAVSSEPPETTLAPSFAPAEDSSTPNRDHLYRRVSFKIPKTTSSPSLEISSESVTGITVEEVAMKAVLKGFAGSDDSALIQACRRLVKQIDSEETAGDIVYGLGTTGRIAEDEVKEEMREGLARWPEDKDVPELIDFLRGFGAHCSQSCHRIVARVGL